MTSDDVLLKIEGLKTYFHTYEGVVKALEGIDVDVKHGETMGLVGETGCGKTVTALSIMRLIQTPPGKIESGKIFFNEPESVNRYRSEYDSRFKDDGGSRKKEIDKIEHELELARSKKNEKKIDLEERLAALKHSYDLLLKSQQEINSIRGNRISMIFQEPLTALNPAYTIGDQIGETIELHQLDKLVNDILRMIDLDKKALNEKKRAKRVLPESQKPTEANRKYVRDENKKKLLLLSSLIAGIIIVSISWILNLSGAITVNSEVQRFTLIFASLIDVVIIYFTFKNFSNFLRKSEKSGLTRGISLREARKREALICSSCGTPSRSNWGSCLKCGARLSRFVPIPISKLRLKISSSYYARMKENSANAWAYLVQSNSITRRLQHRLKLAKTLRAENALREVKIAEPQLVVRNYPFELSGGMRQRAMIAMMMACEPDLLIADEPTTALDVTVEAQILSLMKELQNKKGTSILLITHDLGIIAETCKRVAIMYAGYIVELASTESIFAQPLHPYTNALLKSIPKIGEKHLSERKKPLYVIPGVVPNLISPPSGCRFHPRCEHALEKCKSGVPALIEALPGHFVACNNPFILLKGGG